MKYLTFLLAIVCMMISGCATQPQTIVKTQQVMIQPSEDLVKYCSVKATLPKKDVYLQATAEDKERYLHDYAAALQADMKICNERWDTIRQWFIDQAKNLNPVKTE